VSAAGAGPDHVPDTTNHAASPGIGFSVDWKSCLMQRQPVRASILAYPPADAIV